MDENERRGKGYGKRGEKKKRIKRKSQKGKNREKNGEV